MRKWMAGAMAACGLLGVASQGWAQGVIECRSSDYRYNECYAGDLVQPQLVYQISSSACIVNRTWGFSRNRGVIWVADGCSGRFADVGGYHHGRGDRYDEGSRMYDHRGNDIGAVIGGAVLGAIIAGAVSDSDDDRHHRNADRGAPPPPPGRTEFYRDGSYRGDPPPQPSANPEFRPYNAPPQPGRPEFHQGN